MKIHWAEKKGNSSLVIFFTGWGMNHASTGHLRCIDHDLLVVSDYTTLDFTVPEELKSYANITLIAWSMGVMAASFIMSRNIISPACSIAINGTAQPVSDLTGIPQNIYDSTIDALSENALKKFIMRMCGSKIVYDRFMQQHTLRDIHGLKQELVAIKAHQKNISSPSWNYALCAKHDAIFPSQNMEHFWSTTARHCIITEDYHYPFFRWNSWKELIGFFKEEEHG